MRVHTTNSCIAGYNNKAQNRKSKPAFGNKFLIKLDGDVPVDVLKNRIRELSKVIMSTDYAKKLPAANQTGYCYMANDVTALFKVAPHKQLKPDTVQLHVLGNPVDNTIGVVSGKHIDPFHRVFDRLTEAICDTANYAEKDPTYREIGALAIDRLFGFFSVLKNGPGTKKYTLNGNKDIGLQLKPFDINGDFAFSRKPASQEMPEQIGVPFLHLVRPPEADVITLHPGSVSTGQG